MEQTNANLIDRIEVLTHSAVRIEDEEGRVLYFDPYDIAKVPYQNDADVIFITHDHYDHFSPKDIARIKKADSMIVMPESVHANPESAAALAQLGFSREHMVTVNPGESYEATGIAFDAVASYNTNKPFHPKANKWVGYCVELERRRIFVAGDTDANPENLAVNCDITLVPAGGTYTFTAKEAAAFVSSLKPLPTFAVPTHYGTVTGSPKDGTRFVKALNKLAPSVQPVLKL